MSARTTMEHGLGTLDALRRRSFGLAVRAPLLSTFVGRRDRRLAVQASIHATTAFVLSIYYPVLLFVLGPVLFGVAHVASDVRYLVLRRRLGRTWRAIVLAGCATLVVLAVLGQLRWIRWADQASVGFTVAWAAAGVVAASLRSKAWLRAAGGLLLTLGAGLIGRRWPEALRLAYLHGHNLIALAAWPLFFRTRLKWLGLLRVPILGAAALLASGFAYRASLASPGVRQFGVHAFQLADCIAPVSRADWALGMTSAFVFLQAVHYSVWLGVVPQAEMHGEGTLSFRQSVRALRRDFGAVGITLLVGCIVAVLLLATSDAPRASATYLRLAMFHGYLELVMLLYFWVAREPLAVRAGARPSTS